MDIVLASASPRRKELLKDIQGLIISPSSVNEADIKAQDPVNFAVIAATLKAKDVGQKYPASIVIGADTIVALDNRIFGKPKNNDEARNFLKALSGVTHKVITGIALYRKDNDKLLTDYEITHVTFNKLSEAEISSYLSSNVVIDKAGSYAIQEIGEKFINNIAGEYDNVVGMPVKLLKRMLNKMDLPTLPVEIIDIALPNNWGVAKSDKKVIFVPDAVIGDKVNVSIIKQEKNFSYAEVANLTQPSPFRETPKCPHFGTCGGCAFQNLKYEKQIELKQKYLLDTLRKIGKVDVNSVNVAPITPSPDIYHYRNKMEYAFGDGKDGVVLGLRERVSPLKRYGKQAISLDTCPIFSPIMDKLFPIFVEFARKNGLSAYNPHTKTGFLRHVVIRESKSTGDLMALLITRGGEFPSLHWLIDSLKNNAPQIKSFYHVENYQISDVVNFEKKEHLFGKLFIEDNLGPYLFRIYPEVFIQPNIKAAALLYERIIKLAGIKKEHSILGLYCGTGPIEIFLSPFAKQVIGIDINPVNITIAKENCEINNIGNCLFHQGDVERVLKNTRFENISHVVIDPPRSGISEKGINLLLEMSIPKIIYVSCNPATLARDVLIFQDNGYKLKNIDPFDFFPHTTHMETLVILEKA